MKEEIAAFILAETANPIFRLVALAVVFDTIMGVFRAIKERKFNSCVGINGALRKVGMIVSIIFLSIADEIVSILKNMTLAGLPVKKLWDAVKKFLGKYTEELPDDD